MCDSLLEEKCPHKKQKLSKQTRLSPEERVWERLEQAEPLLLVLVEKPVCADPESMLNTVDVTVNEPCVF